MSKATVDAYGISTHSLTRRLTGSHALTLLVTCYFNSQPHKEADDKLGGYYGTGFGFQLTASQGG